VTVVARTNVITLADGEPTGLLVVEIRNWTGKVLVAPRSQLDQLSKREEVRRTCVNLLIGSDPDDASRKLVYVGESDIEQSIIGSHPAVRKDLEGPASAGILAAWWASR
jgi:hypothetical protein